MITLFLDEIDNLEHRSLQHQRSLGQQAALFVYESAYEQLMKPAAKMVEVLARLAVVLQLGSWKKHRSQPFMKGAHYTLRRLGQEG